MSAPRAESVVDWLGLEKLCSKERSFLIDHLGMITEVEAAEIAQSLHNLRTNRVDSLETKYQIKRLIVSTLAKHNEQISDKNLATMAKIIVYRSPYNGRTPPAWRRLLNL